MAHKVDVLRQHCDDVGRDINEIEVTALLSDLPPSPTTADVVAAAQRLADVGVGAIVVGATGDDPAGWLEGLVGPAMDDLAAIEPTRR